MSKVPLYQEVYQKLKSLIRAGEYEVGELLPPEGELQAIYGVSRTTIRRVATLLASEGYVEIRQGRGTRVLDAHATQLLNGVTSITETLRGKGVDVTIKSIYIQLVEATKRTAERLQIPEQSPVYQIQRVLLADGTPLAIIENFISAALTPHLEYKSNEIYSLYTFFEEEYGLEICEATDIISAKSADFQESQILETKAGAALLTLRRITYGKDRPITYDKTILRADKYQFETHMQGRRK